MTPSQRSNQSHHLPTGKFQCQIFALSININQFRRLLKIYSPELSFQQKIAIQFQLDIFYGFFLVCSCNKNIFIFFLGASLRSSISSFLDFLVPPSFPSTMIHACSQFKSFNLGSVLNKLVYCVILEARECWPLQSPHICFLSVILFLTIQDSSTTLMQDFQTGILSIELFFLPIFLVQSIYCFPLFMYPDLWLKLARYCLEIKFYSIIISAHCIYHSENEK